MNRVTQKPSVRSVKRTRRTHAHHELPKNAWEPLPMERRLLADAIERTRGILRGSRIDPVAWQRRIRSGSSRRLREQNLLWAKLKKQRRTKRP